MDIAKILKEGGVGLLPTDTIYGLSASVYDEKAVKRIFELKGRDGGVPLIVLISDIRDLALFRISLDGVTKSLLLNNWPGRVSFVLSVGQGYKYISRGKGSIAFRMPKDDDLLRLLRKTGPLVSTSANPTGKPPAKDGAEARKYFAGKLDFYEDRGELLSEPSTLVDLTGPRPVVLRQGDTAFRI